MLFDLAQKRPQRLAVGGVAGQAFVGQRQTFGGYHQGDHQLRAIGPLVAAVAVATFVALGQIRGVDLEISAGQIVEQHVEIGVEEIAPAPRQMREQRVLVREQQVVADIELVRLGQAEIRSQQIGHGALAEPLAIQPPLAAGFDQPVGDQDVQDLVPARSLPARGQAFGPKPVELQVSPQEAGQPTGAPLTGTMQAKFRQAQPRRRGVVRRGLAAIRGEQGERPGAARLRVEHLDRLALSLRLRRIDLAQIQNLPLHHPAVIETLVLDDAPIQMRLAVLPSFDSSQEHDGDD